MEFGLLEVLAAITAPLTAQHDPSSASDTPTGASELTRGGQTPAAAETADLDRAKSRVLVNLLNDLRTPLMMIKTPLESGSGIDPEASNRMLDHAHQIQRGLERALKIIQMDAEGQGDDGGATELIEAASFFVSSVRPRAERSGVRVGFESDVRRAVVDIDWPRIELLLENVTEYALRGLRQGGSLTFSVRRNGTDRVVVELRSDGRFEPLDVSAGAVEAVGDPLTLAILLGGRSIRRSQGSLEFVRMGDQASCRISLPAAEIRTAEQAGGAERRDADGDEARETAVLVVDDHAGTRAFLRFALRKHHRILEASDGREALEIARVEKPDLVISDIMMPVMDGNDLCRAIKSDEELNHIPVFLVTANSVRTLKTESLESGADDYLVKPFDVKEAVMRINNEIQMRRQLRSRYRREVVIKPSDITVTPEDEALINRAREIVEENMGNADFSIQDLASEMGLSSRQLQRRLRETLDQSPVEFARSLRLQRAAQLLGGQFGNVSEVAYAVGFTSLSYFAKCFKEEYGTSPSSYKEERG